METLTPLGRCSTPARSPAIRSPPQPAWRRSASSTGDVYMELMARARQLAACSATRAPPAGFPAQFPVVGTLIGIVCGDVADPDRLR